MEVLVFISCLGFELDWEILKLKFWVWQEKETNERIKKLESDIVIHIGKQEAELALKVNSAAFQGDFYQLKSLIRSGADPNKTDYDGRSPLVRFFKLIFSL